MARELIKAPPRPGKTGALKSGDDCSRHALNAVTAWLPTGTSRVLLPLPNSVTKQSSKSRFCQVSEHNSETRKPEEYKSSKSYKECYQGNIDYLEYCGLSQNTSFKIVHLTEMMLIRAVFDTYPILDDKKLITILDHKLMNLRDLLIMIKFNNASNNETQPISYHSNYKNSGIV